MNEVFSFVSFDLTASNSACLNGAEIQAFKFYNETAFA